MAIIPLLPKPKSGDWPPKDKMGIHEVADLDYQRNLCENYYQASDFGTPSPMAWAIVFQQRLVRYMEDVQYDVESDYIDSFELWSLFLKGIYFGILTTKKVQLTDLRDIGKIVEAELPLDFDFHFLCYTNEDNKLDEIVGFTYPEIAFVPSVRLKSETVRKIQEEIVSKDVEKASEYFAGWVHTLDDKDQGDLMFYSLLHHLCDTWNPDAPAHLPMVLEKLFPQKTQLWLRADGFEEDVIKPQIPLYKGRPIICDQCGYQIGVKEDLIEIRNPDGCRCPECQRPQDWLGQYNKWLNFDPNRGQYLIYAFENSELCKPPYSNYVEIIPEGVIIKSGSVSLKVFGLILAEKALKCTRLMFFKNNDQIIKPDLPIRGEYLGLASLSQRDRNPYHDPQRGSYRVTLDVQGWDEPIDIRYEKNEIETAEALLLNWPNFSLPGWNVYYYLLESTPNMNKAGIGLRTITKNGENQILTSSRGKLEKEFDALEIIFKNKDGKLLDQSGVFEVRKNPIEKGGVRLTMAVDFGTSSSSITYRIGDGPIEILRYTDFTNEIIPNSIISDRVLDSSSWLPTYKIDDSKTAEKYYQKQLDNSDSIFIDGEKIIKNLDYFIPSEVLCARPVSAESLDAPLSGFRICHSYATRPADEVLYEIKIIDTKGDPKGRFQYEQIVSRYLEMFLILSIATIIHKEDISGYLHVRASFPRNFESEKIKLYLQCLNLQLKNIENMTGFQTQTVYYMDESNAAAHAVSSEKGGTRVVMDMGGGTTDIAVFERIEGKLKPIFIESLLYGANGYLRMLENNRELYPKPSVKNDDRLLWLLREIRLRSFKSVIHSNYRGNKHSQDVALDLLLRFYKPIAYFISRLFEAIPIHRKNDRNYKEEDVQLYLVGNGWSLGDAHPPIESGYSKSHKDLFKWLLKHHGFNNVTVSQEPLPDKDMAMWPGPKAAVGFGLMKAKETLFYNSIEEACNGQNGIKSILGFDIRFNDGSDNFTNHLWSEAIPFSLDKGTVAPVLSDLKIPEEWKFINYSNERTAPDLEEFCKKDIQAVEKPIMSRSILARFIERVYLSQLDRDRRI